MNILKELQKAWDNAITTPDEKKAKDSAAETLEQLKKDILESNTIEEKGLPERVGLPSAPEPELMERVDIDENKLKAEAISSLGSYEREKTNGIEEKAKADRQGVENRKAAAKTVLEEGLEKIDEAYDAAKKRLDNDALKRGVARSSIAVAGAAELENGRAEQTSGAHSAYAESVGELERLLAEIEAGRISSLADLKADMSSRIAEKTAELKAEARKADAEALKYNNTVKAQAAENEADRLKKEEALYAQALENYKTEQALNKEAAAREAETRTKNMYAENYNKIDAFLSAMNRSDAAEILKGDPFFRANLTDYLYYKLYDKYAR